VKLPLLLASLAALAVAYRVGAKLKVRRVERTLSEWKREKWADAPADAEQRLRDAIGSGRQ
jgi:hypothetical protein